MLLPLVLLAIQSQTLGRAGDPLLDVWPSNPPDGWTRHDQEKSEVDQKQNFLIVSQISHPTLELFLAPPSVNLHTMPIAPTVIVCPGGGYYIEAIEHEGWEIAKRLNGAGINAAVLKYRLPNRDSDKPLHKAPLQDAQRAIRLLRSHAEQYHLDPSNIGILGFSAGGHLAAMAPNTPDDTYEPIDDADKLSPKPDFTVLIYPAYLCVDKTVELLTDIHVTSATPPAFAVQTMDDPIQVENAMAYAHACKLANVAAELHVWPKGGHGYGLRTKEPGLSTWPDLLIDWIRRTAPF